MEHCSIACSDIGPVLLGPAQVNPHWAYCTRPNRPPPVSDTGSVALSCCDAGHWKLVVDGHSKPNASVLNTALAEISAPIASADKQRLVTHCMHTHTSTVSQMSSCTIAPSFCPNIITLLVICLGSLPKPGPYVSRRSSRTGSGHSSTAAAAWGWSPAVGCTAPQTLHRTEPAHDQPSAAFRCHSQR